MRVAIYGAGAMGTVLGAYITKAGIAVDLVNRNAEHIESLRKNGARVEGSVQFTQKVSAIYPHEMTGRYDLIVLMTKQQYNADVCAFLKDYLAEDGAICTAQNGIPEPSVAAVIGSERTYGCAVAWGADFVGSGVVRLTSDPDSLTFALGAYQNDGKRLADFARLFACMGKVTLCDNLIGARYTKLAVNSAFSGLSALTGEAFGTLSLRKDYRTVVQAIFKECINVAKANGIRAGKIQGHDLLKLVGYNCKFKRWISYQIIPIAMRRHKNLRSGMLRDLAVGRRTEIDHINGAVVALGKRVGVPTPINEKIVEAVHQIERGEITVSAENIRLIKELFTNENG